MRREKRNNNLEDTIKWGKLASFIIAIILLIIAITVSMNQEKQISSINYNRLSDENIVSNTTESVSLELSKNINEVKEQNIIGGDNLDEDDSEINEIENSIVTNNIFEDSGKSESNTISSSSNLNGENNSKEQNNENTQTETNAEMQFIKPVEGEVIKEFAKDNLIYSETLEEWITHTGIDIRADRTTIVKATADGTVKSIKNDPRYGLTVTIEHSNGYTSVYSSLLTAEFVKEGEKVIQGQTIGTVGNSAVFEVAEDNHLHFELLKDGSNINPEIYIK